MQVKKKELQSNILLENIMTQDVICVSTEDTLDHIDELFKQKGIHHVPVLDKSKHIVGIISTTDMDKTRWGKSIIMDTDPNDIDEVLLKTYRTVDIMSSALFSMDRTHTIGDAVEKFNEGKIRIIPIVEDNQVIGIVSPLDIINYLLNN